MSSEHRDPGEATDERRPAQGESPTQEQPDPEASSDGDGSWTEDPITADPDEDRSVEAVIDRTGPSD